MYLNIGNNKYSAKSIIKNETEDKKIEEEIDREIKDKTKNKTSDILIGNELGIKTHIALCCLPVPGDEIIGYITKNSGISIHRKVCQNIDINDEKIIKVRWTENNKSKYQSEVIIYTNSYQNIIPDIVTTAVNSNLQTDSINIINKSENTIYSAVVLVNNKDDIEKFIKNVMKIKSVTNVERALK